MTASTARSLAAQALCNILMHGRSTDTAFDRQIHQLSPPDQGWAKALVMGVCRHFFLLDNILNTLLEKPFKKKDNDARCALLCALHQLIHLQTAEHAAVSECLKTLDLFEKEWAKPVANAVLRRFLREQASLLEAASKDDEARFNHPKWLIKRIRGAWGREGEAAMLSSLTHPPMTLRVNQQQTTQADYLSELKDAEIHAMPTEFSSVGIQLDAAVDVTQLPGFETGRVSVQDEAAQLAASILKPQPENRTLDACCAPGGKTCHLLETEPDQEVHAVDLEPKRLQRVQENLDRIGLSAVLKAAPVEELDQWWDKWPYDCILLDVPCSATGVIRRHPDIKLLRRPSDIAPLVALQAQILNSVWKTLKPGGRMLYATCSILPQENAMQVKAFLEQHSDATEIPLHLNCGKAVEVGVQLLPQPNGHDGFYYALLEKCKPNENNRANVPNEP